jgi:hypothetical protein
MFISDDGKNWSSMRFNVFFVCILSSICYWGIWAYVCIFLVHGLIDMPPVITSLYVGIVSVALGAKITQSIFAENKRNKEEGIKEG